MISADSAPRRRGGLWHHRDFRRLWIGETVSQFGSQVSMLALPLVAILVVHASTFEVGALSACESAAFLLIGLPAGAWVDRMRFRLVLIVNDLVRVAAIASIPLVDAFGALTIEQLYAVALVTGAGTVFFDVAYQSYLPDLVDRGDIVEGNAKLQASESVSQIAGPTVGGLLISAITAPYALVVDAVSFLWSATWVASIKTRPPRRAKAPDRHLGREMKAGLAFVLRNPYLRSIAMCTGSFNLLSSAMSAVIYVLLARDLRLSAGFIGLLLSVSSVGGLVGALVASRVAARLGQGPTIWGSVLVTVPTGFVAPFVERNWSIALLALGQFVMFGGGVVYNITQVSFRQGLTPPRLLGRMNATMRFLVWGTMPLGALLGGALGAAIGVRGTLLFVAIGGFVPLLPVFFSPLRRARELPTLPDVPDSETASSPAGSSLG